MFTVPQRDPIKNIVSNASAEDLREVVVDGEWVNYCEGERAHYMSGRAWRVHRATLPRLTRA